MKTRCLLSLLLLGTPLASAEDRKPPLTGPLLPEIIAKHEGLTFDGLRKALPEEEHRVKLDFDPAKARYFDLICEELQLTEKEIAIFKRRGFVSIDPGLGHSMTTAYHKLYTDDLPLLVTTDSILYALHKSYDELLKELETTWFSWTMSEVFGKMQKATAAAAGTNGDEALADSYRDVDLYLTVARRLLHPTQTITSTLGQDAEVNSMLAKIAALQIEVPMQDQPTRIYGGKRYLDYSQFRPRGHYTKSEQLKCYFRAMMWLGRVDTGWNVLPVQNSAIQSDHERELRNAVLFVQLLRDVGGFERLQGVDRVLSYLVGQGDSMNYEDLAELMDRTGVKTIADLRDKERLTALQRAIATSQAARQHIRSQVMIGSETSELAQPPATFQVFGQRFAIDSYVLSHQVYDSIRFDGVKVRRMMPTGLDVMAALGNERAVALLEPELEKWHYGANLLAGRQFVDQQTPEFWNTNLYSLWLDSLRELDRNYTDHPHVPQAMQTRTWQRKQLQTQLASWSQLRHDTMLYVKQSYSAVPGCEYLSGYVEPYPEFYGRLRTFAERAGEMITESAYLSEEEEQAQRLKGIHATQVKFFARMAELLGTLESLARKELAAEPFSDGDRAFLERTSSKMGTAPLGSGRQSALNGWYVELFYKNWSQPPRGLGFFPGAGSGKSGIHDWSLKPTIADVHTDPESKSVLEVGIGSINFAVIAIDSEDDLTAFVGPVMSYYEFTHPAQQRLQDNEWATMLREGRAQERPEWTNSFAPPPPAKRGDPQTQVTFLRKPYRRLYDYQLKEREMIRVPEEERGKLEVARFDIQIPNGTKVYKNGEREFQVPQWKMKSVEMALSDEGLANLREVPGTLRSLDLSKTPIGDAGLPHLAHLTNLRNLSLASTKVGGPGLEALEDLIWLRRLILTGAPVNDEGVGTLAKLPRLEILDLSGTAITSGALEALKTMSYLRDLQLHDTDLKPGDLAALQAALPKCRINRKAPASDDQPRSIHEFLNR